MISGNTHWRSGVSGARDPIAPPEFSAQSISSSYTTQQNCWGKITSRPQITARDVEAVAYILGITVTEARRAMCSGRLNSGR